MSGIFYGSLRTHREGTYLYMKFLITLMLMASLSACATAPGTDKKVGAAFVEWGKVKEMIESGKAAKIYELGTEHLTLRTTSDQLIDFIPPTIDDVNKALFAAPNKEKITWYYR